MYLFYLDFYVLDVTTDYKRGAYGFVLFMMGSVRFILLTQVSVFFTGQRLRSDLADVEPDRTHTRLYLLEQPQRIG